MSSALMLTMLFVGIPLVYSNPMDLLINEYFIGQDGHGFVEIISKTNPVVYENQPDSYNPFQDYNLIIGKRRKRDAMNVKAIINLSQMKFTKNEYLLITTHKNQRFQNSDQNVMKAGSTTFSIGSNNQNLLSLAEDEVLVIYLCYGQFDRNLVIPSGHTTHVELTEELLKKMEQVIVDGLIFGNPKSSTPRKINNFMKKGKSGNQMKKRLLSEQSLSFSRCTGPSNNLPFQSTAFKVILDTYEVTQNSQILSLYLVSMEVLNYIKTCTLQKKTFTVPEFTILKDHMMKDQ